jgi:hypothetical protein
VLFRAMVTHVHIPAAGVRDRAGNGNLRSNTLTQTFRGHHAPDASLTVAGYAVPFGSILCLTP